MQENSQEKSPIKQRILLFLAEKGMSPYEFYKKSGVTRGVLAQNNGISEENLSRFISCFPEVNIIWLITGKGDLICSAQEDAPEESIKQEISYMQGPTQNYSDKFVDGLMDRIERQAQTIGEQRREIEELKRHLEKNASAASIDSTAHAAG